MATPLLYGKQNMGVLALGQRPDERAIHAEAILSFSNRSPSNRPSRFTTPSFTRRRMKRSGSITISKIARDIQRILLPAEAPASQRVSRSAGINIPARQVSGDYFDYIRVDDERLGVAIADVSGKGVPASLIMAICRSVLRSQARAESFACRCFAEGEPPALSRHQGRHVHQHGLCDSRSCAQRRLRSHAPVTTRRCFINAQPQTVTT